MRECKDCHRVLDEAEFTIGSNWKQCKKCKSHDVLLRKYKTSNPSVVTLWRRDGRQWFQDFCVARNAAMHAIRLAVRDALADFSATESLWATLNRRSIEAGVAWVAGDDQFWRLLIKREQSAAWRWYTLDQGRRSWNEKVKAQRKANPELVRAKRRATVAKRPDHYAALEALANARTRSKRPQTKLVGLDIVWIEHDGLCNICGEACDPEWWHLDHIVPLAAGGEHSIANCAPAHPYCNLHKGARSNDTLDVPWLRVTRAAWEASTGARMKAGQRSPCGTATRYRKGCRCNACRTAKTIYSRELRARKKPTGVEKSWMVPSRRKREHFPHPSEPAFMAMQGILWTVRCRETGLPQRRAKQLLNW